MLIPAYATCRPFGRYEQLVCHVRKGRLPRPAVIGQGPRKSIRPRWRMAKGWKTRAFSRCGYQHTRFTRARSVAGSAGAPMQAMLRTPGTLFRLETAHRKAGTHVAPVQGDRRLCVGEKCSRISGGQAGACACPADQMAANQPRLSSLGPLCFTPGKPPAERPPQHRTGDACPS